MVFTATGLGSQSGGVASPQSAYDFRFYLYTGGTWVMVQDFGNGPSYTLTTPVAGTYSVSAWVRTSAAVLYDALGPVVGQQVN